MQKTRAHFSAAMSKTKASNQAAVVRHNAARAEEHARKEAQKQQQEIDRQLQEMARIEEEHQRQLAEMQRQIEETMILKNYQYCNPCSYIYKTIFQLISIKNPLPKIGCVKPMNG